MTSSAPDLQSSKGRGGYPKNSLAITVPVDRFYPEGRYCSVGKLTAVAFQSSFYIADVSALNISQKIDSTLDISRLIPQLSVI